jgi:hypothetical protein
MAVLAELWAKLARPDEYKSHRTLSNDITVYYAAASEVMRDTLHALNMMRADLSEF